MDFVDNDGFVCIKIRKGMYVINQLACIDFERIVKLLKPHVYYPLSFNPGIWCHETLPTKSALCLDDFGLKYTNPSHSHHLVDTLKNNIHYQLIGDEKVAVTLL